MRANKQITIMTTKEMADGIIRELDRCLIDLRRQANEIMAQIAAIERSQEAIRKLTTP